MGVEAGGVEGTGLQCTHSTHGCCWGSAGAPVGQELLCLGELVISHLSEREGALNQQKGQPRELL